MGRWDDYVLITTKLLYIKIRTITQQNQLTFMACNAHAREEAYTHRWIQVCGTARRKNNTTSKHVRRINQRLSSPVLLLTVGGKLRGLASELVCGWPRKTTSGVEKHVAFDRTVCFTPFLYYQVAQILYTCTIILPYIKYGSEKPQDLVPYQQYFLHSRHPGWKRKLCRHFRYN